MSDGTCPDNDRGHQVVFQYPCERHLGKGLAALLGDFRAVAAAGLRGCASTPLTADAARRALSLADAAIQRLGAQVNPKIVLSVLAAKLG